MAAEQAPVTRAPYTLRNLLTVLAPVTLVIGMLATIVAPWLPPPQPAGPLLARYAPIRDGGATLRAAYSAGGTFRSWTSQNTVILPQIELFGALRKAPSEAIVAFYRAGDADLPLEVVQERLSGVEIVELRERELDAAGILTSTTSIYLREPRGELLVGFYNAATNTDVTFDPPVLTLPADLSPGRTWQSEGRFGTLIEYSFRGHVLEAGPLTLPDRQFDDCVQVETELVLGASEETQKWRDWYCAGVGQVVAEEFDGDWTLLARYVTIAGDRLPGHAAAFLVSVPLPAGPEVQPAGGALDDTLEGWSLTAVGRASEALDDSTIPPVMVPGDPPLLLAASYDGDLVAFDARDSSGRIVWRFHSGGTIYGAPAFDAARGRIYFGASDKRLYALDRRGLFLWSFETGDSIATRPLVVGDSVIFGGEDRRIYAVDAETGAERWHVETGAAVVSSPALLEAPAGAGDPLIVAGSDDGIAYAVDIRGTLRWRYTTGEAIEAPIVAAGGFVYVASRDGTLSALDPAGCAAECEAAWVAQLNSPGIVYRTAPAVGDDAVFIVDERGRLSAFSRSDGKHLWTTDEGIYRGPPVLAGRTLVVAGTAGAVYRVGLDGRQEGKWEPAEAIDPSGRQAHFDLGPTVGGGALWLADDVSGLWRLGPDEGFVRRQRLTLAVEANTTQPPFDDEELFLHTVLENRGDAIVLDSGGNVYRVDPATGGAALLGSFGADPAPPEPVVAGDTLLAAFTGDGVTLRAMRLTGGEELWVVPGADARARPPVVGGETVFWLTAATEGSTGTLAALDLATGRQRWQADLRDFALIGGAVVHEKRVFVSTPPSAFDGESGERLWVADVRGAAVGGPALDETGETLFVGLVDLASESGSIAAIETGGGGLRWQVNLGAEVLNPFETLWVDGETLIVPSYTGTIVALDIATGAERWRYTPGAPLLGAVTVEGGRLWLALQNGQLLGLGTSDGEVLVESSDPHLDLNAASYAQRPALVGDHLILPAGIKLFGFEAPARQE